jgi:hypothetical protein
MPALPVMPVQQGAEDANKFRYRVAYQGVPGAYSEMAACKACPDAEPVPCEQFEVAFQVCWLNLMQTSQHASRFCSLIQAWLLGWLLFP